MTSHERNEKVRAGDRVIIKYDDLIGVEAVVRKVMSKEDGTLSIRIKTENLPQPAYKDIPVEEGKYFPLVVTNGEWRFTYEEEEEEET